MKIKDVGLRNEFMGHMNEHDFDDAPDGAWFAMLEEAGEEFIKKHKLRRCDGNDAAHYFLKLKYD